MRKSSYLTFVLAAMLLGSFHPAGQVNAETITADVVAIDQNWEWNRYGSFNPAGMMYALRRDVVPSGSGGWVLRSDKRPRPLVLRANVGDIVNVHFTNLLFDFRPSNNAPATRNASMAVNAITVLSSDNGIQGIAPGASTSYSWQCEREGAFLIWDNASPSGGEGDGGSITLGLFGALVCEPRGSKWYRSQVTREEMMTAGIGVFPSTGHPIINYDAVNAQGDPILAILKGNEIIHSDLNAIVVRPTPADDGWPVNGKGGSYREFTVIFHDEIKAVQAFPILNDPQMAGARDGFAINYGAGGMGPMVVSNRLGIGPAKNCVECAYEEFFLTSWANGDPAMLVERVPEEGNPIGKAVRVLYPDDPSNVHHSYLNDDVVFHNLHAGPKETHVFHLHAHQWLGQLDGENSTYLDSQTIAPFQSYNYNILYGGSGNRNRTAGDSIFHCHLYPHFAQGMWELWRVHDVFEDGSRRLPDGELGEGTNPETGELASLASGSPIPALVPIPGSAMAPLPTYAGDTNGDGIADGFPGYPFFIAGRAGHRPPQPPLDFHAGKDGGLPRHILDDGDVIADRIAPVQLGPNADLSVSIKKANLVLYPAEGTPLEKAAMKFHGSESASGHTTVTPEGSPGVFYVNGRDPQPGAPYADPCSEATGLRTYDVSAIQLDLLVNAHGWHDPQARINVLDKDVEKFEGKRTTAEPFFFRAKSGECIEFRHTNRTPGTLERDHFQVRTPTDTIGQHIHLVKFDVTSSDGSGNGWNYEDGTFAHDVVQELIEASEEEAGGSVTHFNGNPAEPLEVKDGGYQTTVQRWWADPLLNMNGKDRTLRTVFTHDHFGPSSIQQHGFYAGLVVEPAGSEWYKPNGVALVDGVGTQAIIRKGRDQPDFREFMVEYQDFALLYDGAGRPIDPPALPEAISVNHHDPYLINYKHEPIPRRVFNFSDNGSFLGPKAGQAGDMAYVFDSRVHGDPFTEIYEAFDGERIMFRVLQGAQEVQHVWTVNGLRWKREVSNPLSPYVGAQPMGISEHFEMEIPALGDTKTLFSDYLYHLGTTGSLWNGAWGILRSYSNTKQKKDLAPVDPLRPTNIVLGNARDFLGNGCPKVAPLKVFNVEAWAARDLLPGGAVPYNETSNIADPSGLMYILAEDRAAYQAGLKAAEPLVMRANAGDCIEVNLTNFLPAEVPDLPGDAMMPTITSVRVDDFRPSAEVGMHPQLLSYDVRRNDGSNVGFNQKQTVKAGSVKYTWYAGTINLKTAGTGNAKKFLAEAKPEAFGVIPLRSFGDVIKHGSQGLIGALVIEGAGATWPAGSGTVAEISDPNAPGGKFKEFVVLYQDGMNLRWNGAAIPDCLICDDHYDTGEKGLNYRTEPHWALLSETPNTDLLNVTYPADWALGPIETPLFTASPGEAVTFRVTQPDGRARQHTFNVLGHDYYDTGLSRFLSPGSSLIAPGVTANANIIGGAKAGTWLYRDGPSMMYSGGIWGRFEVK